MSAPSLTESNEDEPRPGRELDDRAGANQRPEPAPWNKKWLKALRRHPQTTCNLCRQDLFWDPVCGEYVIDAEWDDCPGQVIHVPANGKRPTPFYGDPGGVSRG